MQNCLRLCPSIPRLYPGVRGVRVDDSGGNANVTGVTSALDEQLVFVEGVKAAEVLWH
jgi:hypothetical protein